MTLGEILPSVNAGLNAMSALLLFGGRVAIKARKPDVHKRLMVSAFVVSSVFLVCYLTRVALTGTHPFPGHGAAKLVYLLVLFSHMALAAVTPILAIRALQLAWTKRFDKHRRVVRWAWPIWMYVSVTGVVVYWMLYQMRW